MQRQAKLKSLQRSLLSVCNFQIKLRKLNPVLSVDINPISSDGKFPLLSGFSSFQTLVQGEQK